MIGLAWWLCGVGLLVAGCNSGVPEAASVDIPSQQLRVTIVRTATDPFLSRHRLTLSIAGRNCATSVELFPDTGYASRRNVYLTMNGALYIVGQFDARIIEAQSCRITLSEFRHLERDVLFVGSFDEDGDHHWSYVSSSQRPEQPFEKRI